MYHSRIVLSVGGSVRYTVRNLRCTVTIDSVLANSKTQNAFLFPVHAIFRHDYPLAVEHASRPRPIVQKKLREILYLLMCSFLPCLSWLLRSRVRKFRRDLWRTLYMIQLRAVITEKYREYLHGEEFQLLSYGPIRFLAYSLDSATALEHAPDKPYKTSQQRPLRSILILSSL